MVLREGVRNVSIHAPAKGRQQVAAIQAQAAEFRSTPLRRGDLVCTRLFSAIAGFDPRPCEGATLIGLAIYAIIAVSIHAPAKGRPPSRHASSALIDVSIHAPAKGRLLKAEVCYRSK